MNETMTIQRQSLRTQVKQRLIDALVSGQIQAGERLVELRIAEDYGVSQAPVREALRDLEALGLVTSRPNRGTFAGDFGATGMHEIFQARAALEEAGTRLAFEQLDGDVSVLQGELDEMRSAAFAEDPAGVSEHSRRFHAAVMHAAGNGVLLRMWEGLSIETHTAATVYGRRSELVQVAESHQMIVDALAGNDVEHACRVAREHQALLEAIPTESTAGH